MPANEAAAPNFMVTAVRPFVKGLGGEGKGGPASGVASRDDERGYEKGRPEGEHYGGPGGEVEGV